MSASEEHMPDEARLKELLVGKSVVKAEIRDEPPEEWTAGPTGYLTLSDGTVLKVWGNDGGCACSAGCYPLADLNECENVITNVKVDAHPDGDDVKCEVCGEDWCYEHEREGYYRIFVWAEDKQLKLASFEGSDGNGYYGTGWWLSVEQAASGDSDNPRFSTGGSDMSASDKQPQVRVRKSVGTGVKPVLIWTGGKRGYLWIGDDEPREPWQSCFTTLTTSEARKLRDMLDDALEGR